MTVLLSSGHPKDIPEIRATTENRRVLLTARPAAIPGPEHFTIVAGPVPEPGPGQALVRNVYLSVDPAQRGWAQEAANYSDPVPLGDVMRALAVGRVERSHTPALPEGSWVYGWFGWQDYCVADESKVLLRLDYDLPLDQCASLIGINGLTAYLALTGIGRPLERETLLVSTAAGAVGSLVGQIGKHLGCRTIGLTSNEEKIQRCVEEYGYDYALNFREGDLAQAVAAAAPEGVDIFYDNTGGTILDTVLRQMRIGGRIVQCGTASIATWNPAPTGPRNEREVLTRRLSWGGFVIFDHAARYRQAAQQLVDWYNDGQIRCATDIATGIEHAPGAIADLYASKNSGKRLVLIS